jgi:5-formyltetrahydrofolate cyclo-ligase
VVEEPEGRAPGLAERKAALRARMRAARAGIPPEERLRLAHRIRDRLFALSELERAGTVLVFYSFGSEVPTAGIIQRLLDQGRRVLLPFLREREMAAAELRPGDSLVGTAYGPKEPSRRVPVDPAEVEAAVAPGLAFDRQGHRLGYGGGHYDRFLRQIDPGAVRVGIGFHLQLVPEVPHGPDDQSLDYVVTELETVACRRGGGPAPG